MPGVVEHVVLGGGRALVGVAEEPVELRPGDVAHVFETLEPDTFMMLVSEHV